jgi:hypothetical protein
MLDKHLPTSAETLSDLQILSPGRIDTHVKTLIRENNEYIIKEVVRRLRLEMDGGHSDEIATTIVNKQYLDDLETVAKMAIKPLEPRTYPQEYLDARSRLKAKWSP